MGVTCRAFYIAKNTKKLLNQKGELNYGKTKERNF